MNNLNSAFEKGKAFIAFITCGDPCLEATEAAVKAAEENGACAVMLGIPFSDPTVESPVVQEANIRALAGGVTTDKVFSFVKKLTAEIKIPVIFRTYANVAFSYGAERFFSQCSESGVCAVVIPDLPFEEKNEFLPVCRKYGVKLISMISPSSLNRIEMIVKEAEGFVYVIPEQEKSADVKKAAELAAKNTKLPCVGECTSACPECAAELAECFDGIISGTAIVEIVSKHGRDCAEFVGAYVRSATASL